MLVCPGCGTEITKPWRYQYGIVTGDYLPGYGNEYHDEHCAGKA